jgi:hypothetical protein
LLLFAPPTKWPTPTTWTASKPVGLHASLRKTTLVVLYIQKPKSQSSPFCLRTTTNERTGGFRSWPHSQECACCCWLGRRIFPLSMETDPLRSQMHYMITHYSLQQPSPPASKTEHDTRRWRRAASVVLLNVQPSSEAWSRERK